MVADLTCSEFHSLFNLAISVIGPQRFNLLSDCAGIFFFSPSLSVLTVLQISHILHIHHFGYIRPTHPVHSPLRFVATDLRFTMRTLRSIFKLTITALIDTVLCLHVKWPVSCVSTAKSHSSSARLILCKPFNWILLRKSLIPAPAHPQDSWIICSSTGCQHWAFFLSKPFFTCKWSPC